MPSMGHGDWDAFGKVFFNTHKGQFGVKLEVAVAMQRRPVPIAVRVVPAGQADITIARGGIFKRMRPGEIALGDPGYLGQPDRIYAPPHRGMHSYVPELDKVELTLQRRVEMANRRIKSWRCIGSVYRKGAVHAYQDLQRLAPLAAKLVLLDIVFNQRRAGVIHITGPVHVPLGKKAHHNRARVRASVLTRTACVKYV